MSWSAEQYLAFEDQRTRPVRDLLQQVPNREVRRAVDVGCGPGNSTEVLTARYPDALVSGFDSSPEMIATARKRLPDVTFEVASVADWQEASGYDVILANAVLQWVPHHEMLFPNLVAALVPGGSLAVQMPDNMQEPAQLLMREVAAERPWSDMFSKLDEPRVERHDAQWHHALLRPYCARLDIWRTTYFHALPGGLDAIVDWFMGSGLRPFVHALDEPLRASYLARYRERLSSFYDVLPDGSALLPFPRLFIVATR
jgi:trans-aconitate 2-methyltransferase